MQLANTVLVRYQNAAMTMASIARECSVVSVALVQLRVIFTGADYLLYKSQEGDEDIMRSIDAVTLGCSMTLSLIKQHLADAVKKDGVETLESSNGVSRKEKAKFVWNEEEVKDLLLQLRGYQSSLSLLLNVLNRYVLFYVFCSALTWALQIQSKPRISANLSHGTSCRLESL